MIVDDWLCWIEILQRTDGRPMDPTRNLPREIHATAGYPNLSVRSVKRGSGE